MNATHQAVKRSPDIQLTQVVEPVADFICASEKPEFVLRSVLAVLRRQVTTTNGLAVAHFATSRRVPSQAV